MCGKTEEARKALDADRSAVDNDQDLFTYLQMERLNLTSSCWQMRFASDKLLIHPDDIRQAQVG